MGICSGKCTQRDYFKPNPYLTILVLFFLSFEVLWGVPARAQSSKTLAPAPQWLVLEWNVSGKRSSTPEAMSEGSGTIALVGALRQTLSERNLAYPEAQTAALWRSLQ